MTSWQAVIGIEVHVELNTLSKMFCRCSASHFGQIPNSHTCPVCLGLPGATPYINSEAINKCIQIGLALGCRINQISYFERKNYFYPDLPKGYQISQLRWPLCQDGVLQIEDDNGGYRQIRINRVHQEEDTGKLSHQNKNTFIDFNRSGVPLVEIVTEPDFDHPEQVRIYAKKLQQIFKTLDVSGADMEKGEMRLEANVSVRPKDQKELPRYRVELKNINSFRFMVAAIDYEIKRQIRLHQVGEKLAQETRGWDHINKETYLQRSKEQARDYRYFPDPDLPNLIITGQRIEKLKKDLPELPDQKVQRYIKNYKIDLKLAEILVRHENCLAIERLVDLATRNGYEPKAIINLIINNRILLDLGKIVDLSDEELVRVLKGTQYSKDQNLEKITEFVNTVIEQNPGLVEQYKKGKTVVLESLIGQFMKLTFGKMDANIAREVFQKLLK